jgi:predicted pyridoxine 5'-phosphate oxidase superfamily flavin-nucleotide-binding protein
MATFHEGEIAVQEGTGQRAAAARLEKAIRDTISNPVASFIAQAATLAVCASSPDGELWASVWFGAPGFILAGSEGRTVRVERDTLVVSSADPVHQNVRIHDRFGMLAIDFATRRRVRINGTVLSSDDRELVVSVEEAFPNCPMYIRPRQVRAPAEGQAAATVHGHTLDAERRALFSRADTAFVASTHPRRGLDVSHRGGPPGFIVVENERTLRVPDYPGNNMFATLGNFVVSPKAGIAIVDFHTHRLLSLTGDATVSYESGDARGADASTRFWRMAVSSWIEYGLG